MVGRTLSQYRVTERLGSGGMGEVYLAQDTTLGRQVALKVLTPEIAKDPSRLERFRREAHAVASLNHPNIVTLHSIEEADGLHFLVMEYVEGKTLAEYVPRRGLNLATFFKVAVPLADALAAAHEHGVIHRDLKPGNIMVTKRGVPKILDFGLAKLQPVADAAVDSQLETESLTDDRRVVGTLSYMAPEQIKGKKVDHRSDIFSLGIVLYSMATGRRPFGGDTSADMASSILRDEPEPVDMLRAEVPHHLARIIRHALEKSPERRLQSAKDLRNDLEDLRREVTDEGTASTTRTLSNSTGVRIASMWKGHRLWLTASLVIVGIIALAVWQATTRSNGPPSIGPEAQGLLDQGHLREMRGSTRDNLEAAEKRYRRALGLVPENAEVMARLAAALALLNAQYPDPERTKEIQRLAEEALEKNPDLALAHVAVGRQALFEGDTQAASEAARRAVAAAPESYHGHSLLGQALIRQNREDQGLVALRQGVAVAGSDIRARTVLAYALKHLGSTEEAAAQYLEILRYDPDYRNALNNLGVIYTETGRDLDAIPLFKRLLQLEEDESAASNLGVNYFNLGRFEEAIEAFLRSHRIDPAKPLAPHSLGDAYERQGDLEKARDWYATAVDNYDRAIEAGGERSFHLVLRAVCVARLGNFDQAKEDIQEALALEPKSGWRLFYAAQVYTLAGDRAEAFRHVDLALEAGYARQQFMREPAFEDYRGDTEFLALLESPAS